MTLAQVIWYYLWIAPHLLLIGVLILSFRSRLYLQFPIFSAYLAFETTQFVVLFAMARMPSVTGNQYGIAYTIGLAASTAIHLGMIYEISAHLLENHPVLSFFGKPSFRWITVGLLLAALLLAIGSVGHDPSQVMSTVHILERTAGILQCGLLVLIFALAHYFRLSWRSNVFGIALGLGIFSSAELAVSAIRFETGFLYGKPLDYLIMATYHCCVLIWAFYLWVPERSSQYALKALPQSDLDNWNQELQRLLKQ